MPEIDLDLVPYLSGISACEYVFIKLPRPFLRLHLGEDLDIVAVDKEHVVERLLVAAKDDLESGMVVRVTYGPEHSYVHVDLLRDDLLQMRFDVASKLASFGSYRIKDVYAERMLAAAGRSEVTIRGVTVPIRVADELDELVVRYLEYHELFGTRPDKVKHLEYVMAALETSPRCRAFFGRLHENIELPTAPPGIAPHRRERTSLFRLVPTAIRAGRTVRRYARGLARRVRAARLRRPRRPLRAPRLGDRAGR
jgi:hypothetical protein